jgi:putative nucleotidyltransferase with HDIG domain
VIDDNEWIRDTLKQLLAVSGYQVDTAANGGEGLSKVKSKYYDTVLTDIQMPKMDGLELLKQIKEYDPALPVVMITGFPTVDTAIQAMKQGASDFITKPFRYEQVSMVVDKLVKERAVGEKGLKKDKKIQQSKTIESLNQRLNKKVKELSLLYSISESMSVSQMSSDDLFNRIVGVATELVEAGGASLLVFDNVSNELIVEAKKGNGLNWKVGSTIPIDKKAPWKDVMKGKHLIVNGGRGRRKKMVISGLNKSNPSIFIPLKIKDSVFGVLNVFDKLNGNKFEQEDIKLLQTLARKASLNIENTVLYESMYTNLISTLQSLVAAIEARDRYTQQHSQRVTRLSVRIAEEMNCSQDEIDTIKFAGILHDIGKISISDSILLKEGKLTPEEMKLIQTHPVIGEKILRPLGLLPAEKAIVRHHHERWDGKGYPDGLAGDKVPLLARILAVADSYDAMTTDRPYRLARNRKKAVDELIRCSGTQFDRKTIEAFKKIYFSKSFPKLS